MGMKSLVIGVIVSLAFAVAMMSFAVFFIQDNNPTNTAISPQINASINSLRTSTTEFQNTINNSKASLDSSQPLIVTFAFLIFQAAFDIPKMFLTVLVGGTNALFNGLFPTLFGVDSGSPLIYLFGVLGSIFMVTVIFLIIQFIRTGSSER